MALVYQFVSHRNPSISFDPSIHIDKTVMFDKLLSRVGIITVLQNNELKNCRVTLMNSLTTPHSTTSDPNDDKYWLFCLDSQEWMYIDINNIKHFEVEEW